MLPTLLSRDQQKQHDYLYWEFPAKGGRVAIRKGDWKAVRYRVATDPNSPLELYDLAVDLGETNNVADKYPGVTAELNKLLRLSRTEPSNPRFRLNGAGKD